MKWNATIKQGLEKLFDKFFAMFNETKHEEDFVVPNLLLSIALRLV